MAAALPDLSGALRIIERDYARSITIAQLARLTKRSPFQFIRAFRRAYGTTPGRRLRARRLERACELLTTTPAPVTEICRLVGYQSLGTFSRVFRRDIGESPLAYRRRTRKPVQVPGCFVRMFRAGK